MVEPFFFEQKVDHFDSTSQNTFAQLYYVVDRKFYKPGGPIFLYSLGEGAATPDYLEHFGIGRLAKATGGLFVVLEHRFYGTSQPSPFTVENLQKYHTVEQSLEDFAHFIRSANITGVNGLTRDTKWIVAGCSYAGALAAWMRTKYPDLVFASLAGSAPVQITVDFFQYQDEVRIAYDAATTTDKCGEDIVNIVSYIDNILDSGSKGDIARLYKDFGFKPNTDPNVFADTITTSLSNAAQYDHLVTPNRTQIDDYCAIFSKAKTFIAKFQAYVKLVNRALSELQERPEASPANKKQGGNDENSWTWQYCTQFGYFQIAPSNFSSSFYSKRLNRASQVEYCKEIFGPTIPIVNISLTERLKARLGGGSGNTQDRIVWTNGQFDPWSRLSVTEPVVVGKGRERRQVDSPVYAIGGAGHCSESFVGGLNFPDVPKVQNRILGDLNRWLGS